MLLEKEVVTHGDEDLTVEEMKERSGKEEMDTEAMKDFIVDKAKGEGEKKVLERIVNNSELMLSLQKEYYLHTPDEVKTTTDFIQWLKNWEERRGNL